MLSSKDLLKKYDLSSVRLIYTGAAPLGKETAEEIHRLFPNWHIGQGYGTTSTSSHPPAHYTHTPTHSLTVAPQA